MSQSVLYQWLSVQDRLKVKYYFYQTLNEYLNKTAKEEYSSSKNINPRSPGVHGSILRRDEKPLDQIAQIAFDQICREMDIHRHSPQWDDLLKSDAKDTFSIYHAIGKGVALVCAKKAGIEKDLPRASSFDYEQFGEQFYKKVKTFDKSLKIYAHVSKKCSKLLRRIAELNLVNAPSSTTSNSSLTVDEPTRVCTYAFSAPKDYGAKIMY